VSISKDYSNNKFTDNNSHAMPIDKVTRNRHCTTLEKYILVSEKPGGNREIVKTNIILKLQTTTIMKE
jgi:hypothetical protein